MNISKLAALGLVVALGGACDKTAKPEAEGASNNKTATQTNSATAKQDPAAAAATLTPKLPFEATGPVARVNGAEIGADAYNEEVKRIMAAMGSQIPPQALPNLKGQIIEQLISKKLVEDAVKTRGITVTDNDVNKEFQDFKKKLDAAAPGGAKEALARMGRSEKDILVDIKRSLELKEYLKKDHDIAVADADVKKFYNENKKQFAQPERVRARHILFKVEENAPADKQKAAEKKAIDIAAKAKAPGADFAELAKANSEGPTAPRGGDLGFFGKGQMVPQFDEVAWKLKPGTISDPVKTKFGYHVIKVEEKSDAKTTSFDEAQDMIRARLEEPKLKTAMKTVIDALKAAAKIERLETNITMHMKPPAAPPGMMPGMPPGMPPGMGGHPPMSKPPGAPPAGQQKKLKLDQLK